MKSHIRSQSRRVRAIDTLRSFIIAQENPPSVAHSARMASAAVASLSIAQLLQLPESYWAVITTLIVTQSTFGATLPISVQRLAGTALGAAVGAWIGTYFPGGIVVFSACVLLIGILCSAFRLQRSAYRYASITLAVVLLMRSQNGWIVAVHRTVEVLIGIAVGLAVSVLWPEQRRQE